MPHVLVAIASFMIRYLELVAGELGRMRIAMASRGHDPRWIHQARPIASSAGALFIRTYERGERVHAAMVARGFNGEMPALDRPAVVTSHRLAVLTVVSTFLAAAITAMALT